MDYKGFGRSEDPEVVEDLGLLYDDSAQFIIKARQFYQGLYPGLTLPFYTYGYSFGSKITLFASRLLKERALEPLSG